MWLTAGPPSLKNIKLCVLLFICQQQHLWSWSKDLEVICLDTGFRTCVSSLSGFKHAVNSHLLNPTIRSHHQSPEMQSSVEDTVGGPLLRGHSLRTLCRFWSFGHQPWHTTTFSKERQNYCWKCAHISLEYEGLLYLYSFIHFLICCRTLNCSFDSNELERASREQGTPAAHPHSVFPIGSLSLN